MMDSREPTLQSVQVQTNQGKLVLAVSAARKSGVITMHCIVHRALRLAPQLGCGGYVSVHMHRPLNKWYTVVQCR